MANLSTNYNVSQCKSDLQAVLHGTTLNQVAGVDNIFNRTARQFLLDCDPQETIRIAQTPTLFDKVFDYSISNFSDIKGNRIIDVRPQVARTFRDVFHQTYSQEFDVQKNVTLVPNFTFEFNAATKSIRVDATDLISGILLNNADGITTNGTWVVGTNASNLAVDSINAVDEAGSSLKFDLASGSNPQTGYVRNTTMTAQDLTTHLSQSTLFWYVYLPTGADFSSVYLKFGSSTADYWQVTATTNWQGQAFNNGWNLIGGLWPSTKTGNPTITSISYVEIGFTYNGNAETAVHINSINSRLGQIFQILYYSKFLFRDSTTQTFQETVTADDNLINLDTEAFPIFFNLLAYNTFQQIGSKDNAQDVAFYGQEYARGLMRYKELYKSQATKPKLTYYSTPKPSYQKFFGRGWWQ